MLVQIDPREYEEKWRRPKPISISAAGAATGGNSNRLDAQPPPKAPAEPSIRRNPMLLITPVPRRSSNNPPQRIFNWPRPTWSRKTRHQRSRAGRSGSLHAAARHRRRFQISIRRRPGCRPCSQKRYRRPATETFRARNKQSRSHWLTRIPQRRAYRGPESQFMETKAREKQVPIAEATYKSALAAVERAKAALQQAELNLAYTHITAPITGQVTQKSVDLDSTFRRGNCFSPSSRSIRCTSQRTSKETQMAKRRAQPERQNSRGYLSRRFRRRS